MSDRITSSYLHALQACYYDIGERGIRVDRDRLERAKLVVAAMIEEQLRIASAQWGIRVYIGAENAVKGDTNSVNLNSTGGEASLLKKMQSLGYKVPLITKKNNEGDYESKYSTGELALQKMLATNQFNHPNGDNAIRAILRVRELGKLNSAYLNAKLSKRGDYYYFLSGYNVAGTLTGRRSSKKHAFGFGNNGQNFPSHSDIAGIFRTCLVARPKNILLSVDQVQAEDWPVSALSQNTQALIELRTGVDRHSKLATAIFGQNVPSKTDPAWDKSKHEGMRYMGKKVRHARNYGMRAQRMSDSLAQEGKVVNVQMCQVLLDKAAAVDPSVTAVFHTYIRSCLERNQTLYSPFGWERQFLSVRPNSDNNSIFNEAYSWIPQHTVGANTGFAVFYLEENYPENQCIIQEGHDSIVQDIPCSAECILQTLERTSKAFDRKIKFHNGIEIQIPIEAELSYDFDLKVSLDTLDESGVRKALDKLNQKIAARNAKEAA